MKLYFILSLAVGLAVLAFSATNSRPSSDPTTPAPFEVPATTAPQPADTAAIETAPVTEPTTTTGSERLLGIQRDMSGSGNEAEIKTLLPALIQRVRSYAESLDGVAVIRVGNGNRPTLAEPVEIFRWKRPEIKPFVEPNLENAPLNVRLFADRKRRYIAQARAKYNDEKDRLLREFYTSMDRELDRLNSYLLQPPTEPAPCTRFSSIATRIERDNYPLDILITDGWRDCRDERNRQLSPVRTHGKLVVIQLTRNGDTAVNESELRARESFLRRLFPTAEVMPAYMAGEAVDFLFR